MIFLENQHLKITSNPTSKTQPTAADPMLLHKNRLVSAIILFHNGQEDLQSLQNLFDHPEKSSKKRTDIWFWVLKGWKMNQLNELGKDKKRDSKLKTFLGEESL